MWLYTVVKPKIRNIDKSTGFGRVVLVTDGPDIAPTQVLFSQTPETDNYSSNILIIFFSLTLQPHPFTEMVSLLSFMVYYCRSVIISFVN